MLIPHENNQGTVLNVYDALKKANGRFVKLISPGDALVNSTVLYEWINHMIMSGHGWSMSESVYYRRVGKNAEIVSEITYPQDVTPYIHNNENKCRWNYAVIGDKALGAATLCTKELFIGYMERIINKVVYCEDCAYALMMFDGEVAYYYPKVTLNYEFGEGVSTSGNSVWAERLRKDWNITDRIMINCANKDDEFQMSMAKNIKKKCTKNKYIRFVRCAFIRGYVKFFLKIILCPRKTSKKYTLTMNNR